MTPSTESQLPDDGEQHLRESGLTFQSLLELCPAVIAVVGPDGRIRHLTRPMARMLGTQQETRVGDPVTDLLHPHDQGTMRRALSEGFTARLPRMFRVRLRPRGLTDATLDCRTVPIVDETGTVLSVVLVARPVAERDSWAEFL
jgi:PAS domain S-box-containing protein